MGFINISVVLAFWFGTRMLNYGLVTTPFQRLLPAHTSNLLIYFFVFESMFASSTRVKLLCDRTPLSYFQYLAQILAVGKRLMYDY
jgi:hypothetical protein